MKILKWKYLAILVSMAFYLQSCDIFKSTDPKPKTELEKLPGATQTGENIFGCLVNGKALVVVNTSKQWAIFQQGQLEFGASFENENLNQSVDMILGDPLINGIDYSFIDPSSYYHSGYSLRMSSTVCLYEFENTFSGSVTFSKMDRVNFIIAGTFEFSTVTSSCDTIRITDGRFDMQYIP